MALDRGDYAFAATLLEGMDPGDAKVRTYLSCAWAGRAGIDVFNLLRNIETLDENPDAGSVTLVNRTLGIGATLLGRDEIEQKTGYLENAILVLVPSRTTSDVGGDMKKPSAGMTEEQRVLSGMLGLTQSILAIADLIVTDVGDEPPERFGAMGIELTEAGLARPYTEQPFPRNPAFTTLYYDSRADVLTRNAFLIENAVLAIDEILDGDIQGHSLGKAFETFLSELDPDNRRDISIQDIALFVNRLYKQREQA